MQVQNWSKYLQRAFIVLSMHEKFTDISFKDDVSPAALLASSHVGRITRCGRFRTVANANVAWCRTQPWRSTKSSSRSREINDRNHRCHGDDLLAGRDSSNRSIPPVITVHLETAARGRTRRPTNNTPGGSLMRHPTGRPRECTWPDLCPFSFSATNTTDLPRVPRFPRFRARPYTSVGSRNLRLRAVYTAFVKDTSFPFGNDRLMAQPRQNWERLKFRWKARIW